MILMDIMRYYIKISKWSFMTLVGLNYTENYILSVNERLDIFLEYMEEHHQNDGRILKILDNDPYDFTAIDGIRPSVYFKQSLDDWLFETTYSDEVILNTIMYVVIWELTHYSYEYHYHCKEFWENFDFLLSIGQKAGIYESGCGDNPLNYRGSFINPCFIIN